MKQQVLAGYQRARNKANKRRESPSRKEMCLRTAVRRLGYPLIGYEFEAYDSETGRSYWFDICYRYNNQDVMVDLKPYSTYNQQRVKQWKLRYCRKWDIPYIIVKGGSVAEIQAQIIQFHQLRRWSND